MSETNHLCDQWQHTIAKIFKHGLKSQVGIMTKELVIFNKWKISIHHLIILLMI